MNINVCYIILNILFLLVSKIYLKKYSLSKKNKLILLGIYLLIAIIAYSYIGKIINSIFKLKYLDVKSYIILLIATNTIILYTLNKHLKTGYKIINYILFMTLTIILGAILSIVLGNKFNTFYIMDIKNAVNLMDLSFVIFILYLITISLIYIGYYIMSEEITLKEINVKKIIESIKNIKITSLKQLLSKKKQPTLLTPEELLNYSEEKLYIHGEDCSIIFEDSNKENIIKNYYRLTEDIHATLMNGYTLEENKILRNVCMKLHTGNLKNVDLNNSSIINRISVDEYQLLKKVAG